MNVFAKTLENLAAFKRVPLKVVLITAAASYVLQLGMIIQGQPLYVIALATLVPWIPVLAFESLWKIKHYHWVAVFAVVVVLQLGHLGEHLLQAGALQFTEATLACPPPVDNAANARAAIDAGLRDPNITPTGLSSASIVAADPAGMARIDVNGNAITGIPACGVFGQLDLEIVHLLWDTAGWILTLLLLWRYPRNMLMWLAMFWSSVHTVEHLFISYTFFLDNEIAYESMKQLWGTVANGNIVTAWPLGKEPVHVTFYDVAGKFGLFAKNGFAGNMFPGLNDILPTRPFLHFYYNSLIVIPTVLAFVLEVRRAYDHYLAQALPGLTQNQLVEVTPKLEALHFKAGENIITQGDIADTFYVVSDGTVGIYHENEDGSEVKLNTLHAGQYFGEMGLLGGGRRLATVRAETAVEVMAMNAQIFSDLIGSSEMSRAEVERLAAIRRQSTDNLATNPA